MVQLTRANIVAGLFAIVGLLSLIANFSLYKVIPLMGMCIGALCLLLLFWGRSFDFFSAQRFEVGLYLFGWGTVFFISTIINYSPPPTIAWFYFVYAITFLLVNVEIQKTAISYFVWLLALLFFASVVEYLIYLFTRNGIVLGHVLRSTAVRDTYHLHLLFNLISDNQLLPRFHSLADEPGRLGTLSGLLLYFTSKVRKFRIPFIVFLLSGIISFSLAFYVLLAAFVLFNFRFKVRYVLVLLLIVGSLYKVFQEYVDVRLLSRIENIENIDNRTSNTFEAFFEKAFYAGDLWLGVGSENLPKQITMRMANEREGGNAGAKKWIYEYGIVGFIIIFFMYIRLYRVRLGRSFAFYDIIFLLVFWASFYQRHDIHVANTTLVFMAMPLIDRYKDDDHDCECDEAQEAEEGTEE